MKCDWLKLHLILRHFIQPKKDACMHWLIRYFTIVHDEYFSIGLILWDFSQFPNMGISFNGYFWGFSLVFIFLNKGCSEDITQSVYFTASFRFLLKLWLIVSCRIHGPCDIFFPFKKYVKSCSKVHKHLYKNIWWENLLYVSHTLRICTLDLL